jgi:AcrR family transcriptional regulator
MRERDNLLAEPVPIMTRSARGRPRNSSGKTTREKLMRAAARQFSSGEYSEVDMKAIAGEAGLTPAAIYNHFASKDELFIATAVHMTQVNLVAIEAAIDAAETWRTMLFGILRLVEDDATGWFGFPLLVSAVQLRMLQNPDRFAAMLELRRCYAAQFGRIVEAAIVCGDLPGTLSRPLAAQLLMSFVFNGMAAVLNHHRDDSAVHVIIETAAVLLGASAPMGSSTKTP